MSTRQHTLVRWFHLFRRLGVVGIALAALLAAGCAGESSEGRARTGATPTAPASAPAVTAPALTGVPFSADAASVCTGPAGAALTIGDVRVGAFDAWQVLPATLPLRPEPVSVAVVSGNVALNAVTVDIGLTSASPATPAYLCAVTARIVAFQPLAAPMPNLIRACSDHPYLDPGGADYGGDCGTELGPPATAAIHFAAATPGSTTTVPVHSSAGPGQKATFPSPDGRAARIGVLLAVPASGTYTFVVGLWQDRAGPAHTLRVSETFNLDVAHEWSGQFCTTPAMQALLPPPADPPTPLLCPGSPPAYS